MKTIVHTFFLLGPFLFSMVHAQSSFTPFQKYLGGTQTDVAISISLLNGNSLLIAGLTNSNGIDEGDGLLLETDFNGQVLSSRTIDHGKRDRINEAFPISPTKIMVAGNTTEGGIDFSDDILAVYTLDRNNTNTVHTSKFWGTPDTDDQLHGAILTEDHKVILLGMTATSGVGKEGVIIKMDTAGNVEWSQTFNMGTSTEHFWRIVEGNQGYYITGTSNQFDPSDFNIILAYIAKDGTLIFGKTYDEGSMCNTIPYWNYKFIHKIDDNSFLLAESIERGGDDVDILVINIDSTGNPIWAKAYGGAGEEVAYFMEEANDGNILVGGSTNSYGEEAGINALLFKIDPAGNLLWAHSYGGERDEHLRDIQGVEEKGKRFYVAVGSSNSFNIDQSNDVYLLGVNEDGSGFSSCYTPNIPLQIESRNMNVSSGGSLGTFSLVSSHTTTVTSQNLQSLNTSCAPMSTSSSDLFAEQMLISPNPSSGHVRIETPTLAMKSMHLYDMTGRQLPIRVDISRHEAVLHLSADYTGLAIVEIWTEKGLVVRKVVFE